MASKYAIETAFRLIDSVSRPLSKITGNTRATSRELKNLYAGMENATARLGRRLSKIGGGLVKSLGLAAVLNPGKIIQIATSDIKNAIEFQTALAKVGTVADTAAVPLDKLSKQIIKVSSETGVASNQIAESVYTAITAGISTEKAAAFVQTATKAAIGGFTSEATAIDALTSVINAYGLEAEHAAAVSDRMLLTQNLGKTSFNDMAQAMGKVVPYAAHLGVTVDELFASITSLTGSGSLKTTDAMSSMKAMLTSVINPSKEAADTARALGVDFSAAALQSKGFAKFIQEISDAANGNQAILGKLFGSDKADAAVRILTSTGKDAFLGAMDAMKNSAGSTEAAFQKMMDTPEKRWAKVMNTIRNAGISFGTAILPVIEQVIAKIGAFADNLAAVDFTQFQGAVESTVSAISFFAGALVWALKTAWALRRVLIPLVFILGGYFGVSVLVVGGINLITKAQKIARVATILYTWATKGSTAALGLLKKGTLAYALVQKGSAAATKIATAAQWALNAAMTANPIGLIIAAIVAAIALLVVIIIIVRKNWDSLVGAFKTGSAKLMAVLSLVFFPLGIIVSIIREIITSWDSIKKAFTDGGILKGLLRIGGVILSAILAPIQGLLEILSYIPGLGHLAGKGAEKIAEMRNFLRGDEKVAANIKAPKIMPEVETVEAEIIPDFGNIALPDMSALNLPGFDGASAAAVSGAGGKSKIHGVYDVSGAASVLGGSTTRSSQGMADAATNAVDSAIQMILSVIRNIDVNITRIAAWSLAPEGRLTPAPVTQGERAAYSLQGRRDLSIIELRAAQGTEAEIKQAAPETHIRLIRSGGNTYA